MAKNITEFEVYEIQDGDLSLDTADLIKKMFGF